MGSRHPIWYRHGCGFSSRPLKVQIDEEKWLEADSVIISTGASAKWLGLESEQRLNGFGVSASVPFAMDSSFFGKEVAIVGGGRHRSGRGIVFV